MEDIKIIELTLIEKYEIRKAQIAKCIKDRHKNDPEAHANRNKKCLDYYNNRYHTDPVFCEKMKKHQRDLYHRTKAKRLIEMQNLKDAEELKLKQIEGKLEKITIS